MGKTGLELIRDCQLDLGETTSSQAQLQSQRWPTHIRDSADELARRTKSFYATMTTDIVNAKQVYEVSEMPFKLEAIDVTWTNGSVYPLAPITPNEADNLYFQWRNPGNEQMGVPVNYIIGGNNYLRLFPLPNYDLENGLIIEGLFGIDRWWDMQDECPLPQGYEEAIRQGAMWRRCKEMRLNPDYASGIPLYKADYDRLVLRLYREAMTQNAAAMNAGPPLRGRNLGYWNGWAVWGSS